MCKLLTFVGPVEGGTTRGTTARVYGQLHSSLYTVQVQYRVGGVHPTGLTQEAKYVERWPNTTSAWAGWSRFDSPVDRHGGVHSLIICTNSILYWGLLPATGLASRKILTVFNKISKSGQGQHSCYSVGLTVARGVRRCPQFYHNYKCRID